MGDNGKTLKATRGIERPPFPRDSGVLEYLDMLRAEVREAVHQNEPTVSKDKLIVHSLSFRSSWGVCLRGVKRRKRRCFQNWIAA